MRFYKGQVDERGRVSGYSYGFTWAGIKVFFGIMMTALLLGWPLLIHGPAGVILEFVWVALAGFILVVTLSSKGAHRASRREAAAAREAPSDEPVYDGDPPAWYKPPEDDRPGGRSVGTRFQS
jgi:hypothetical protein